MLQLLSRTLAFFWRRAELEEEGEELRAAGGKQEKIIEGVVTRFCLDYGMINDLICFTSDVVISNVPLQVGQKVRAVVEEDKMSNGVKAIRVEVVSDKWEENGSIFPSDIDSEPKTLIGSITAIDAHGGCINHTTFFPMAVACEGFQPCKGDWVEAEYLINPANWTTEAISVKPLRYKRIDKARISTVCGKIGVIDDSVFFTLESLRLPTGYLPHRGDLVNVVVAESNQSCYVWRALCMAPAHNNGLSLTNGADLNEPYENLMEDKEGLEVSKMTSFGTLKLGETKSIGVWIE